MSETVTWREHRAWLEAFEDPIPASLASPQEIAEFEAASFARRGGEDAPSFRFVLDGAMGMKMKSSTLTTNSATMA